MTCDIDRHRACALLLVEVDEDREAEAGPYKLDESGRARLARAEMLLPKLQEDWPEFPWALGWLGSQRTRSSIFKARHYAREHNDGALVVMFCDMITPFYAGWPIEGKGVEDFEYRFSNLVSYFEDTEEYTYAA